MILTTEEIITITLQVISTTTKVILATKKSNHIHIENDLNHYKSDLDD